MLQNLKNSEIWNTSNLILERATQPVVIMLVAFPKLCGTLDSEGNETTDKETLCVYKVQLERCLTKD